MDIKILGTGCPKCKRVESLARKAVEDLGVEATLTKVEDIDAILAHDVMTTPALVIDGQVKASGRVPREEEITQWIRAAEDR
jgi:small redox-active disulfide protein 2